MRDMRTLRRLRCPRCKASFSLDDNLVCGRGHVYAMHAGVPRLLENGWSPTDAAVVAASAEAFGRQWKQLGEAAAVTTDDLALHLPGHWDADVFSGDVLDAGCGMGRYTELVRRSGARAVGLDVSDAVDKAAELWPDCAFVQADIAVMPFASESFELVYSFGALHHLPDPAQGFRACFDLVRPGGRLLVWVYGERRGVLRRARRMARALVRAAPLLRFPVAGLAAVMLTTMRSSFRRPFYDDKRFGQIFVDCHDALVAPSELYFSSDDCANALAGLGASAAGFEPRRDGSGWVLWAVK